MTTTTKMARLFLLILAIIKPAIKHVHYAA